MTVLCDTCFEEIRFNEGEDFGPVWVHVERARDRRMHLPLPATLENKLQQIEALSRELVDHLDIGCDSPEEAGRDLAEEVLRILESIPKLGEKV